MPIQSAPVEFVLARRRGRPLGRTNSPACKRRRGDVYVQRLRVTSSWLIQVRRRLRRGAATYSPALEREALVLAVNTAQLIDLVRAMRPDTQGAST